MGCLSFKFFDLSFECLYENSVVGPECEVVVNNELELAFAEAVRVPCVYHGNFLYRIRIIIREDF